MRARRGWSLLAITVGVVFAAVAGARPVEFVVGFPELTPDDESPDLDAPDGAYLAVPPRPIRMGGVDVVGDEQETAAPEFLENWIGTASRAPRGVGDIDEPPGDETQAAILAVLEAKRVRGLHFHDQNLDQVITHLRTVTGLNYHITPKVRALFFDDVQINVPGLDDVSVRWILTNVVTRPFGLDWEIRDGVVTIVTTDEVRCDLRIKYFDVKDLSSSIWRFRGNEIFLSPCSYVPPDPPELDEPEPISASDALLETICRVVDPSSWDHGGTSIDIKNGTLIVKNAPATIERVGRLLAGIRECRAASRVLVPTTSRWNVVDLVGNASSDGSVAPIEGDASPPPFAPGALVALVRATIDEEGWTVCKGSIELSEGWLAVQADMGSLARVEGTLREIRARADLPCRDVAALDEATKRR